MFVSYDYYRIFYNVAKYGSFTAAAEALMGNQPNITRAVKNLESELGCTLFVRSNKGVRLTPEGEKLYARVAVAVENLQAAENELALDRSMESGIVSIGVTETALHCLMLPILRDFHAKYPGIRIKVSSSSSPQTLFSLKSGLTDLAVVTMPADIPNTLYSKRISAFREAAICSDASSMPPDDGKPLTLAELAEYPLIFLGRHTMSYDFYSKLFLDRGIAPSPDIETATASQVLSMVKYGLGVGFVPESFLSDEANRKGVRRIALSEELPEREIHLVRRRGESLSIAADKLVEAILESQGKANT